MIAAGIFLNSSPIYAQDSVTKRPFPNDPWVSSEYNFESGKPEDRGAASIAMVWSDQNEAVGVAIYASPDIPKEKVLRYGEGLMRFYKARKIPAKFYAQHLGDGSKSGMSFKFFLYGYPFGTYGGKNTLAGMKLTVDGYNGEAYVAEMLEDGSL